MKCQHKCVKSLIDILLRLQIEMFSTSKNMCFTYRVKKSKCKIRIRHTDHDKYKYIKHFNRFLKNFTVCFSQKNKMNNEILIALNFVKCLFFPQNVTQNSKKSEL